MLPNSALVTDAYAAALRASFSAAHADVRQHGREPALLTMSQVQTLPDVHTDFIFSLRWEGVDWPFLLIALVGAAAFVVVLLYVRRRGRRN